MAFGRSRRAGTVGLFGKPIADREIGKHSFCSAEGVSGRCQAMIRPESIAMEPFNRKRTTAAGLGTGGGERILRCVGSPACVAKNRYDPHGRLRPGGAGQRQRGDGHGQMPHVGSCLTTFQRSHGVLRMAHADCPAAVRGRDDGLRPVSPNTLVRRLCLASIPPVEASRHAVESPEISTRPARRNTARIAPPRPRGSSQERTCAR